MHLAVSGFFFGKDAIPLIKTVLYNKLNVILRYMWDNLYPSTGCKRLVLIFLCYRLLTLLSFNMGEPTRRRCSLTYWFQVLKVSKASPPKKASAMKLSWSWDIQSVISKSNCLDLQGLVRIGYNCVRQVSTRNFSPYPNSTSPSYQSLYPCAPDLKSAGRLFKAILGGCV